VKSLATATVKMEQLPLPADTCEAMTVGVIARAGQEIVVNNMETMAGNGAARQSLSILPSSTTLNFSDDEAIGAWIYKSSRTARLFANSTKEASPSLPSSVTRATLPPADP